VATSDHQSSPVQPVRDSKVPVPVSTRSILTLPLWLDLPSLRVVHACWHAAFTNYLAPKLQDRRVPMEILPAATREPSDDAEKDTPEPSVFKAVEALTRRPRDAPAARIRHRRQGQPPPGTSPDALVGR
jgi:hypothetical protein